MKPFTCPGCGNKHAVQLMTTIQCSNIKCRHYDADWAHEVHEKLKQKSSISNKELTKRDPSKRYARKYIKNNVEPSMPW